MIVLKECHRKNLCVDCDDHNCAHAGDIGADCPKWTCDMAEYAYDCSECGWIKRYVDEARKEMRNEQGGD